MLITVEFRNNQFHAGGRTAQHFNLSGVGEAKFQHGFFGDTVFEQIHLLSAAAFDRRLESWRTYGLGGVLQAFLAHAIHAQGAPVTVHDTDGSVLSGSFAGLEESDGALRLRLADGSERVIRAGDIS